MFRRVAAVESLVHTSSSFGANYVLIGSLEIDFILIMQKNRLPPKSVLGGSAQCCHITLLRHGGNKTESTNFVILIFFALQMLLIQNLF